jgi:hypothetical protein
MRRRTSISAIEEKERKNIFRRLDKYNNDGIEKKGHSRNDA